MTEATLATQKTRRFRETNSSRILLRKIEVDDQFLRLLGNSDHTVLYFRFRMDSINMLFRPTA